MAAGAALLAAGCSGVQPLATVDSVDLDRFMGDWYVIANIPTFIEKGAHNAVESYRLDSNGTVATTFTFRDGSFDGVFSAYVFRNLTSVDATIAEVARVLRPGGHLVVVGLSRPPGKRAAALHRAASAVFLPTAGSLIGAREEYAYLHESLDKLPPPEELFADQALALDTVWRMGPLGFVYGALLKKS